VPHPRLKLGKTPHVPDDRDLLFAKYAKKIKLPEAPNVFGFGHLFADNTGWRMLGNGPDDSVAPGFSGAGDCVLAGGGHETMVWNKARGGPGVTITGANSIADYSALTGYVIGDDATDQGTDMREAAKYRKATGLIDANGKRHKIAAYLFLTPGDFHQLVTATYIFGCAGVGIEFPDSAWAQYDDGQPWDVTDPNSPIDGGHYIPTVGSTSAKDEITAVTWARRQPITKAFIEQYNDESVVYLSEEMIRSNGEGLHGFDLATFKADLAAL